jgi:hypothetical protein
MLQAVYICLGRQTKQIMVAKFQTLICLFAKSASSPSRASDHCDRLNEHLLFRLFEMLTLGLGHI